MYIVLDETRLWISKKTSYNDIVNNLDGQKLKTVKHPSVKNKLLYGEVLFNLKIPAAVSFEFGENGDELKQIIITSKDYDYDMVRKQLMVNYGDPVVSESDYIKWEFNEEAILIEFIVTSTVGPNSCTYMRVVRNDSINDCNISADDLTQYH